jgi:hypothetical protein
MSVDLAQLKTLTVDQLEKMNNTFAAEIDLIKDRQRAIQFELGQRSRLEKFSQMTSVLSDSEKAQLMQVLSGQGIASQESVAGSQVKG